MKYLNKAIALSAAFFLLTGCDLLDPFKEVSYKEYNDKATAAIKAFNEADPKPVTQAVANGTSRTVNSDGKTVSEKYENITIKLNDSAWAAEVATAAAAGDEMAAKKASILVLVSIHTAALVSDYTDSVSVEAHYYVKNSGFKYTTDDAKIKEECTFNQYGLITTQVAKGDKTNINISISYK